MTFGIITVLDKLSGWANKEDRTEVSSRARP